MSGRGMLNTRERVAEQNQNETFLFSSSTIGDRVVLLYNLIQAYLLNQIYDQEVVNDESDEEANYEDEAAHHVGYTSMFQQPVPKIQTTNINHHHQASDMVMMIATPTSVQQNQTVSYVGARGQQQMGVTQQLYSNLSSMREEGKNETIADINGSYRIQKPTELPAMPIQSMTPKVKLPVEKKISDPITNHIHNKN